MQTDHPGADNYKGGKRGKQYLESKVVSNEQFAEKVFEARCEFLEGLIRKYIERVRFHAEDDFLPPFAKPDDFTRQEWAELQRLCHG